MASNYTENLGLCQWEATDHVLRTEFNEDNQKIDAALGKMAEYGDTIAQHTTTIARLGNCQIHTRNYTGNGVAGPSNPNTLYFPKQPLLVLIFGNNAWFLAHPGSGCAWTFTNGSNAYANTCRCSGGTFSWNSSMTSASTQMNVSGVYYHAVALVDAAQ